MGEEVRGGVSLSIISGRRSPEEEDCWGRLRARLQTYILDDTLVTEKEWDMFKDTLVHLRFG